MFTETADTVGTFNTGMIGTDRLPAITQPPGWPITLGTGRGVELNRLEEEKEK